MVLWCSGILYMKKLWEISSALLRRHRDWCIFGITLIGLTCWGIWYLSPQVDEPRFRFEWSYNQPAQHVTLSELRDYISKASQRCEALKREVKALRAISTASPEEKQLEDILSAATWSANTESHIQYTYNLLPESFDHEPRIFRPFTERQQRIIRFGEVIDAALSLRSKEGILTALVAENAQPTKIEGFYTNYREMELVVGRTAEGYQVRLGGSYGNSHRAYGYEFMARREGDTLIGKAGILQGGEEPAEQVTLVIVFNRGIAHVKGGDPLGQGTLVKLADLRATGKPIDTDFTLGAGACSRDSWDGRLNFLRSEVTWVSEARPGLYWDAHFIYSTGDEVLGGSRANR